MAAPGRRRAGGGRTGRSLHGATAGRASPWRPVASGARPVSGSATGDAVDAVPVQDDAGPASSLAKVDFEPSPRLKRMTAPALPRSDHIGISGCSRSEARGFRPWPAAPGTAGLERRRCQARARSGPAAAPSPAISSRRSSGKICALPWPMRTIFRGYVQLRGLSAGRLRNGHFFAANGSPCYKPAARGIAAGHDAFSGRGGTGRRAGFRFQ